MMMLFYLDYPRGAKKITTQLFVELFVVNYFRPLSVVSCRATDVFSCMWLVVKNHHFAGLLFINSPPRFSSNNCFSNFLGQLFVYNFWTLKKKQKKSYTPLPGFLQIIAISLGKTTNEVEYASHHSRAHLAVFLSALSGLEMQGRILVGGVLLFAI